VELERRFQVVVEAEGLEKKKKSKKIVPPGNDGGSGGGSDSSTEDGPNAQESRSEQGDQGVEGQADDLPEATSPEGSEGGIVPPGNDEVDSESVDEKARKNTLVELLSFQKPGGTVPERGGIVPQTGVSVPPGNAYLKNRKDQKLTTTPVAPASGGVVSSLAASAETQNEKQEQKPRYEVPPDRPVEASLRAAVAKAMREMGLTGRRHEELVERQLRNAIAQADEAPDLNAIAEAMIAAREDYSRLGRDGLLRFGPYGITKFLSEAIWRDEGLWGINHEAAARRRRL
jgi:hypothetical protein